jgi:hypothetical protein
MPFEAAQPAARYDAKCGGFKEMVQRTPQDAQTSFEELTIILRLWLTPTPNSAAAPTAACDKRGLV